MLTNDDKALILLCSNIGLKNTELKPLTLRQWNELAMSIIKSNIKRPENLFSMNDEDIIAELNIGKQQAENIINLLSRSVELGIELERLYAKGIKVITRASNMYPTKLKKKLKDLSPPVIFYCGNLALANEEGIGIVGSRNIKEEYVEFTKELVKNSVNENLVIFSGGARGIDDTSEKEAFINGGRYVSFLADSLEAKIKKKDVREKLSTNRVLLMTATNPSTGFNVGFAMNRNKYIYSLSEATFVIASDYNKGGTWTGAVENLKNGWTKTFVRQDLKSKGVQEIIKLGATPIDNLENISTRQLINDSTIYSKERINNVVVEQLGLDSILNIDIKEKSEENSVLSELANSQNNLKNLNEDDAIIENYDIYYYVVDIILKALKEEKTIDQLVEILNVNKVQINNWLSRAIEEKKVKKLYKPVRYICV